MIECELSSRPRVAVNDRLETTLLLSAGRHRRVKLTFAPCKVILMAPRLWLCCLALAAWRPQGTRDGPSEPCTASSTSVPSGARFSISLHSELHDHYEHHEPGELPPQPHGSGEEGTHTNTNDVTSVPQPHDRHQDYLPPQPHHAGDAQHSWGCEDEGLEKENNGLSEIQETDPRPEDRDRGDGHDGTGQPGRASDGSDLQSGGDSGSLLNMDADPGSHCQEPAVAVQQARSQTPFFEPKMGVCTSAEDGVQQTDRDRDEPPPQLYAPGHAPCDECTDGGDPREEGDNTNGTEGTEAQVDGRDQEGPPPELGGQAGAQHSEHAHDGNRTEERLCRWTTHERPGTGLVSGTTLWQRSVRS